MKWFEMKINFFLCNILNWDILKLQIMIYWHSFILQDKYIFQHFKFNLKNLELSDSTFRVQVVYEWIPWCIITLFS